MRPGVKTDDVLAEVDKQIAALRDKPVDAPRNCRKPKTSNRRSSSSAQDSIFNEAMLLGVYEMLGDYKMIDQYLPQISTKSPRPTFSASRKNILWIAIAPSACWYRPACCRRVAGGGGGAVHHADILGVSGPSAWCCLTDASARMTPDDTSKRRRCFDELRDSSQRRSRIALIILGARARRAHRRSRSSG